MFKAFAYQVSNCQMIYPVSRRRLGSTKERYPTLQSMMIFMVFVVTVKATFQPTINNSKRKFTVGRTAVWHMKLDYNSKYFPLYRRDLPKDSSFGSYQSKL